MKRRADAVTLSRDDYAAIAAFRHQLRRFLLFSEAAAAAAGLPAQQHQALLAIAGHTGDEPAGVGDIARQLIVAPHTATELIDRMVEAGLVRRETSRVDRRRHPVVLTRKASTILASLTRTHLRELSTLTSAFGAVARISDP